MSGFQGEPPAALLGAADRAMHAHDYAAAASLLEHHAMQHLQSSDVLLRLAAARRALGDIPGALEAAEAATRADAACFPALLMAGSLLETLGRKEDAAGYYEQALRVSPKPEKLPPAFRDQLDRGRRRVAADRSWRDKVASAALPHSDHLGRDAVANLETFRQHILQGPDRDGIPRQFMYPGLSDAPFYDPANLPMSRRSNARRRQYSKNFELLFQHAPPKLLPPLTVDITGVAGLRRALHPPIAGRQFI